MAKSVLVTGGAGFIGSHVADALLDLGHTVHVMDNLSTGRGENVPEAASFFELDIRSDAAADLIATQQYDCIVHHAAQMDVRRSVEDPQFDADVNIGGLLNLMEAGVKNGLETVILASTGGAIYGEPEFVPQTTDHPLRPVSPYGIAKLASEKYLAFYQNQYDIRAVSLRYGNVYGPRQNAHGEAGVVAIFAGQMLNGEQPVIYGDGTQTRDYVYVSDVVRANIAALQSDESGVFNVGTGKETSVNEIFDLLSSATNANVDRQYAPGRPGEQNRSVLGYEQTFEKIGWMPKVELEKGILQTVDWIRETAS